MKASLSPSSLTDSATGTTFLPGRCNDLDEGLDRLEVLDGDGHLVAAWAALYLGDHATPVTAALCRALDLPVPGTSALGP
ncbi:hypothetical protein [Streptomyces griseorubiginosus]|uniref:hypothetical protein n=1 Tax=Streptomyces griseorubiginosus TaxID=67304 RepID=UPI00365A3C6A